MFLKSVLFLVIPTILTIVLGDNTTTTKVSVAVYYESLCPDSQKFFTSQLYPSLQNKNISEWIDLQLVPYGKTTTIVSDGDQIQFQCHHGPPECIGNKIQACALHEIEAIVPTPPGYGFNPITLALINCLMSKADRNESNFYGLLKNCSEINNVPQYVNIESCANHPDGSKYLAEMGQLTDKADKPIMYIPLIVFNGALDRTLSKEAETNFVKVLCGHIPTSRKLAECKNSSGTATLSFLTFALILAKYLF